MGNFQPLPEVLHTVSLRPHWYLTLFFHQAYVFAATYTYVNKIQSFSFFHILVICRLLCSCSSMKSYTNIPQICTLKSSKIYFVLYNFCILSEGLSWRFICFVPFLLLLFPWKCCFHNKTLYYFCTIFL